MTLKFSEQAQTIINSLKKFDQKDFENWYFENLIIGGSNITAYLMDYSKRGQNGNSK